MGLPCDSAGKASVCNMGDLGSTRSLDQEDSLEKGMATHSSILSWRIPWTEEPSGLHPCGHKESDTTEWLTLSLSLCKNNQ